MKRQLKQWVKRARGAPSRWDSPFRRDAAEAAARRHWAASAQAWARHLEVRPDHFGGWVQYGHMLKEAGRLQEAAEAYDRAHAVQPDDPDLLFHHGHLMKRIGRGGAAADLLHRAHNLGQSEAAGELIRRDLSRLARLPDLTPPIVGAVESASASAISGWVAPDWLGDETTIELVRDGRVVATAPVDIDRPDLESLGYPSPPRAFYLEMTALQPADREGEYMVRLGGSGPILTPSRVRVERSEAAKAWLARLDGLSPEAIQRRRERMTADTAGQLLSIVMPIFNTPEAWLREAIASVRDQWCGNWELICVDDGSSAAPVREVLEHAAAADARIRLILRDENGGIARATNDGLRAARGDYVALLDNDDVLEPEAVFRLLDAARTGVELIYTDEIITGPATDDIHHFVARPAFSRDYYLSHPYFVHLVCVERETALAVGGFDETMSISADVDFVLRVIERAERVAHVPAMLYRWRTHSRSAGHQRQDEVTAATTASIQRSLERQGSAARVSPGPAFNAYRVDEPDEGGRTLVIIPTRDRVDLLRTCIQSLFDTTPRDSVDILVVDHQSVEPETAAYLDGLGDRVRVMRYAGPFNFSAINNAAVRAYGDGYAHLLFLNNDIEAIEPGWLEHMRGLSARPDVGVVGATLLYPDRRIQHSGVVLGIGRAADHAHKFALHDHDGGRAGGYNSSLVSVRNYLAVTAACMMMRAEVFTEVGGFDEAQEIGFNDTDLCLRIGSAGYQVLNDGHAVLYHHESASRALSKQVDHPEDDARFLRRWRRVFADGDPFYSPLLAGERDHEAGEVTDMTHPVRVRQTRPNLKPLSGARPRFGQAPIDLTYPGATD